MFFEGLNSLLCALPTYSKCTLSNMLPPRRAHVTLIDLMVSITVDRLASKWQLIKSDIAFENMMRRTSLCGILFPIHGLSNLSGILIDRWSFSLSTISLPVKLIELLVSLRGGGFSKVCLIPWTTKSRDWCPALFCSFFIRPKFDHCLDLAHRYDIFLSSLDVEINHSLKHDHLK